MSIKRRRKRKMDNGITRKKLVEDLQGIGLQRGDLVYVHSSMKRVGWIQDGINGLTDAFLEVLGEEETLAVPTHFLTEQKSTD
jgi:aminoglycoside 3-N-acetyltransferase